MARVVWESNRAHVSRPDPGYHSGVRAVGIDFGGRRIGIAVSDASRVLARPLETLERAPGGDDARAVAIVLTAIARLEQDGDPVETIVVGLPRRLDGSPNDQTPLVERFVAALRAATPRVVVVQDERLTSHEAEARLSHRERDWRKRKARLDAAAAAVILQDYLDSERPALNPHFDAFSDRCGD
jgi:putative holliday junction resolvase